MMRSQTNPISTGNNDSIPLFTYLWRLGLALAICLFPASLSFAQETDEDPDAPESEGEVYELEEVIAYGLTASMQKAQALKREEVRFMDSIVADDINKLPDLSVTEALQRISGIQVTRDLGEGANVSLRGLTDVTSTLNGQEVFSPQIVTGESRTMNLQTIPSDMIEGGIAGTIDIQLRKPLDFDGDPHANINLRLADGELSGHSKMQYSGMYTDIWETDNGRFGALVSYTKQARIGRQDLNSTGAPKGYNVGTENEVIGPNGSFEPIYIIDRDREGTLVSLQFAPSSNLSFFLEFNKSEQTSAQDTLGTQFESPSNTAIDIVTSGTTITYTRDNPVTGVEDETVTVPWAEEMTVVDGDALSQSAYRYWYEDTSMVAGGFVWNSDKFLVEGELAYTETYTDFFYNGIWVQTDDIVEYRHDMTTDLPQTYTLEPGVLLDVNNFASYWGSWTAWRENNGDALTGSIDVTQSLDNGFFRSLQYGTRYNDRASGQDAYGGVWLHGYDYGNPPDPTDYPDLFVENTMSAFFDGAPGKTNEYLYPDVKVLRAGNVHDSWAQLAPYIEGTTDLPDTPQDRIWEISEETIAGYAMANFSNDNGIRFDGNIGVRAIKTNVTSDGYKRISGGDWERFEEKGSYTDVLPSLNTRWYLNEAEDFFLRVSLSKQLSRQSLSSLNSRVTLNPVSGQEDYDWTGSAGNPNLEPLRTDAIDIALEKYFNPSTYIYASFYDKKIDGYTERSEQIEIIDGERVLVSRPYNVNDAKVSGYELGYQQFFEFLPGPLSGLGINANFTYVDAQDPSGNPLQNLSKKSYNIILMYEYAGFSARVAYNWRDSYVRSTTSGGVLGTVPLVDEDFGWMDASLGYDITDSVRVQLDVTNVLQVERQDFYGHGSLYDHEDILEDRMWYLSVNWKL